MRYLNPKADLTFKRVFGEHPDLVISLLNALLPLAPGQEIMEIENTSTRPNTTKLKKKKTTRVFYHYTVF